MLCRLLEEITLVDTPGVLSGEKQRIERTYNFIDVCGWFAARCDLILLVGFLILEKWLDELLGKRTKYILARWIPYPCITVQDLLSGGFAKL